MNWTEFGSLAFHLDFPGGSLVKKSPARAGDAGLILGQEAPLEKEMATDAIILAWEIPWPEEPGGLYSPWGRKESDTTERLTLNTVSHRAHSLRI